MTTQTSFEIDAYALALEQWDIDALLDMYAPDTQLVQIIGDATPEEPRIHNGRDTLAGMFTHCAKVGVRSTVHYTIAGPERAAAAITCAFPDGRAVTFNEVFELHDGRIVRQTEIAIRQQPAS